MNPNQKVRILRTALKELLDVQSEDAKLEHDFGGCGGIGHCILCDARKALVDTMPSEKGRIYVGNTANKPSKIFRSETTPTFDSHGHLFTYALGPFKTMRGAKFYLKYGHGNPHCTHVSHIEKMAKQEENERKHGCYSADAP